MTQDEIMELATQAGFDEHNAKFDTRLEAFAKLVADRDREQCAKVFDDLAEKATSVRDLVFLSQTAAAIRARVQS